MAYGFALRRPIRDAMDILSYIGAIRDGGFFPSIRPGVGVDAAGSHFLCPYLRRLHELVVDTQRGNTISFAQSIGPIHDVLLHGVCIIGRRRDLLL